MRTRAHGIARYTWIIDFVHERATTGASKIPVALLIVVNYLLYTTSFQMRFRRFPRADKSNCDLSRYRCVSCRQSYHSNRTFTRCSEFLNMRSVRALRTVLLLTSSLPSSSFCTLSLLFAILLSIFLLPLLLSFSLSLVFSFRFALFLYSSRFFSPFLPLFHPARLFASYYYCFLPRILFFALACFILVMLLIMLLSLSTRCHMRTCILSLYRLFFPPPPNSIIFFIFFTNSFFFLPSSFSFCFLPVTVSS